MNALAASDSLFLSDRGLTMELSRDLAHPLPNTKVPVCTSRGAGTPNLYYNPSSMSSSSPCIYGFLKYAGVCLELKMSSCTEEWNSHLYMNKEIAFLSVVVQYHQSTDFLSLNRSKSCLCTLSFTIQPAILPKYKKSYLRYLLMMFTHMSNSSQIFAPHACTL